MTKVSMLAGFLLLLVGLTFGATRVVEAEVISVTAEAVTLKVDGKETRATLGAKLRAWRERRPAKAADFEPGERVRARLTDGDPPECRELVCAQSGPWLDAIRKGYVRGQVKARDEKTLTLAFEDGTEHVYRITKSSQPGDASVGQTLWVRGRTLSTLDTMLVSASAEKPETPAPKARKPRVTTPKPPKAPRTRKSTAKQTNRLPPLPASGQTVGVVDLVLPSTGMLDLKVDGRLYHFRWTPRTRWTTGGEKSGPADLERGLEVTVKYRRDPLGRLILSLVEM